MSHTTPSPNSIGPAYCPVPRVLHGWASLGLAICRDSLHELDIDTSPKVPLGRGTSQALKVVGGNGHVADLCDLNVAPLFQ